MTSSRTLSNQSLLRRARQGSRSALNHLLERSRPVWLNRARENSRGRSPGNSIPRTWSRSAYIEAAARFGEFRGHSLAEFRAWMRAIFDHKTLHHVRHWQRKKRDRKREESLPATGGVPDCAGRFRDVDSRTARAGGGLGSTQSGRWLVSPGGPGRDLAAPLRGP